METSPKVCDAYCEKCVYYQNTSFTCNYIFFEDRSRGCPPGTGCDKRTTRSEYRKRMSISLKPIKARKPRNEVRKNGEKQVGVRISADENIRRMELYKSGLSDRKIAEAIGVAKNTISRWRKVRNLPANFDSSHRYIGAKKTG